MTRRNMKEKKRRRHAREQPLTPERAYTAGQNASVYDLVFNIMVTLGTQVWTQVWTPVPFRVHTIGLLQAPARTCMYLG